MSTQGAVAASEVRAAPLEAFSGTLTPTRTSGLYKLGLGIVAFAMVLLPLVYISLIGLTAWSVWWHLRHNLWIIGSTGRLVPILVYLAPALAG